LTAQLPEWLTAQRWFAAKDRPVRSVAVAQTTALPTGHPELLLDLLILRVEFDDGPPQHYQLLLGRRPQVRSELEHMVIGRLDGEPVYDALWDHDATAWLLEAIRSGRQIGDVRFVPEPGAKIAPPGPGRVLTGEQSNTSV